MMRKINWFLFALASISIVAWLFLSLHLLELREVRLNGQLVNVVIKEFHRTKSYRYAIIEVDDLNISTGTVYDNLQIGDTIQVYYLSGSDVVVDKNKSPNRYLMFLGLASILLVMGIALFIESLKGENIWNYI